MVTTRSGQAIFGHRTSIMRQKIKSKIIHPELSPAGILYVPTEREELLDMTAFKPDPSTPTARALKRKRRARKTASVADQPAHATTAIPGRVPDLLHSTQTAAHAPPPASTRNCDIFLFVAAHIMIKISVIVTVLPSPDNGLNPIGHICMFLYHFIPRNPNHDLPISKETQRELDRAILVSEFMWVIWSIGVCTSA